MKPRLIHSDHCHIVRLDRAGVMHFSVGTSGIKFQFILLPEQGEVRPDGHDHGDVSGKHVLDFIVQPPASDAPACAEGEPVAAEKGVQSRGKHQSVYPKLRDNGKEPAGETARQFVIFFLINARVFKRGGKHLAPAAQMDTIEIQQQIQRCDHAAANLAHRPGRGNHLASAKGLACPFA